MDKEKQEDLTLIVLGALTTVLLICEIVLITRKKIKLKPFEKLLLSLAISDILVTVTVMIFKIFDFYLVKSDMTGEDKFFVVLVLSITFSVGNIFAITIDRFLAVRFPLKHRVLMTGCRMNKLIVVIWALCCFSVIFFSIFVFVGKGDHAVLFIAVSGTLLLYGILVLSVYIYIVHMSMHRKVLIINNTGSVSHRQVAVCLFSPQFSAERNILYTCCLVTFSYIICSFPFAIEILIVQNALHISFASKLVLCLNSSTNPIVYFFKGYLERRMQAAPSDIQLQ